MNGQGKVTWSNGGMYVGDLKNGKQMLTGNLYFSRMETSMLGNFWKEGKEDREPTLPLKEINVGEHKDGKRNGLGTIIYGKGKAEGDKYVGVFKDGNGMDRELTLFLEETSMSGSGRKGNFGTGKGLDKNRYIREKWVNNKVRN